MNVVMINQRPIGPANQQQLDGVRDWFRNVTDTVKSVIQDAGKTAVNTVTRPALFIAGKDPIYTRDEFDTGFFRTGSDIQAATTAAGAGIAAGTIGFKATQPSPQPTPTAPQPSPNDLMAQGPTLSPQRLALIGGGVLLLGALAYYASKNNEL